MRLEVADARAFAPRRGWNGWIVTNPPYGERIGDARTLAPLYAAFGARLREHAAGYHLGLLTSSAELADALGVEGQRIALSNGALECTLVVAELA